MVKFNVIVIRKPTSVNAHKLIAHLNRNTNFLRPFGSNGRRKIFTVIIIINIIFHINEIRNYTTAERSLVNANFKNFWKYDAMNLIVPSKYSSYTAK
jgi:hypothetical protein